MPVLRKFQIQLGSKEENVRTKNGEKMEGWGSGKYRQKCDGVY